MKSRVQTRFIFILTIIIVAALIPLQNTRAHNKNVNANDLRERCIAILRNAMTSGNYSWMNVHAAEALIADGRPEGVEARFRALEKDSTSNIIGICRVRARLHANSPATRQIYVDRIRDEFLDSDSLKQRITALESLGKLGYSRPLPEIRALAENGEGALKAFSRWVLANSGDTKAQARLAALLRSTEPTDYFYAAYALRFFKKITPESYASLDSCAARLAPDAPHRVYVLSALFVHASPDNKDAIRKELLKYVHGEKSEKFEMAQALAICGTVSDIPVLEQLLDDQEMDVQVSAANALLQIERHTYKE